MGGWKEGKRNKGKEWEEWRDWEGRELCLGGIQAGTAAFLGLVLSWVGIGIGLGLYDLFCWLLTLEWMEDVCFFFVMCGFGDIWDW